MDRRNQIIYPRIVEMTELSQRSSLAFGSISVFERTLRREHGENLQYLTFDKNPKILMIILYVYGYSESGVLPYLFYISTHNQDRLFHLFF